MNPAAKERLAFEIQRLKELPPRFFTRINSFFRAPFVEYGRLIFRDLICVIILKLSLSPHGYSLSSLGKVTQADAEGFAFNVDVAESPALDTRALPARFAVTIPPTWPARAPQAVLVCAGSLQRDTYSALAIGKPVGFT